MPQRTPRQYTLSQRPFPWLPRRTGARLARRRPPTESPIFSIRTLVFAAHPLGILRRLDDDSTRQWEEHFSYHRPTQDCPCTSKHYSRCNIVQISPRLSEAREAHCRPADVCSGLSPHRRLRGQLIPTGNLYGKLQDGTFLPSLFKVARCSCSQSFALAL